MASGLRPRPQRFTAINSDVVGNKYNLIFVYYIDDLYPIHYRNNSEPIVAIGLNLVTVAIERGSTHLCQYSSLTALVQDSLCKFLLNVRALL